MLVDRVLPFSELFQGSLIPDSKGDSPLSPHLDPSHPNSYESIVEVILPIYTNALPTFIKSGKQVPIQPIHHFVLDLKGTAVHAKNIAYASIKFYSI